MMILVLISGWRVRFVHGEADGPRGGTLGKRCLGSEIALAG